MRVLIVDDHALVRQGIISVVARQSGIQVVGEAADGEEAVELADKLRPDVVLMDVNLPRLDGVEATRQIKGRRPAVQIIGASIHDEREVASAMHDAGASARLRKAADVATLVQILHEFRQKPR